MTYRDHIIGFLGLVVNVEQKIVDPQIGEVKNAELLAGGLKHGQRPLQDILGQLEHLLRDLLVALPVGHLLGYAADVYGEEGEKVTTVGIPGDGRLVEEFQHLGVLLGDEGAAGVQLGDLLNGGQYVIQVQ